jgi:hypothetical protein
MALLCIYGAVELVAAAGMFLGFLGVLPKPVLWWAFVIFLTAKLLLPLTSLVTFVQSRLTIDTPERGWQPASRF